MRIKNEEHVWRDKNFSIGLAHFIIVITTHCWIMIQSVVSVRFSAPSSITRDGGQSSTISNHRYQKRKDRITTGDMTGGFVKPL